MKNEVEYACDLAARIKTLERENKLLEQHVRLNADTCNKYYAAIKQEIGALKIWRKNRELPLDVKEGIDISLDMLERL